MDDRLEAAKDWARSIQQRYADRGAAEHLRETALNPAPSEAAVSHAIELHRRYEELGGNAGFNLPEREIGNHELDEPWVGRVLGKFAAEMVNLKDFLQGSGFLLEPLRLDKIVISSLPTRNIVAICAKSGFDDFTYIFVDSDLLTFCAQMGKIITICIEPMIAEDGTLVENTQDACVQVAATNEELRWRTLDLMASTIISGSVRASALWAPLAKRLARGHAICSAMERFVVAHEIAHVMLGHFEQGEQSPVDFLPSDSAALLFSHEAEYSADVLGFHLCRWSHPDGGALPAMGTYLFLLSIDLLYACQAVFELHPDEAASSHPAPIDRATSIRPMIIASFAKEFDIERILDTIDAIFDELKSNAIDDMLVQKEAGFEPARKIRDLDAGRERPSILGVTPFGYA